MNKIVILFASIFISGCSEWSQGDGHYQIYIDKEFNADQNGWIKSSINDWVNAVGTEIVTFKVTNDWRQTDNLISISPSTATELTLANSDQDEILHSKGGIVGYTSFDGTNNIIQISTDGFPQNEEFFAEVTAHEIGHALGLVHTNKGELMYYVIEGQAKKPTCKDVIQFCGIWNCDALKLPGCR